MSFVPDRICVQLLDVEGFVSRVLGHHFLFVLARGLEPAPLSAGEAMSDLFAVAFAPLVVDGARLGSLDIEPWDFLSDSLTCKDPWRGDGMAIVMAPSGPCPIMTISLFSSSESSIILSQSFVGSIASGATVISACLVAGSSVSESDAFLLGDDLFSGSSALSGLFARGVPASSGLILRLKVGAVDGRGKLSMQFSNVSVGDEPSEGDCNLLTGVWQASSSNRFDRSIVMSGMWSLAADRSSSDLVT